MFKFLSFMNQWIPGCRFLEEKEKCSFDLLNHHIETLLIRRALLELTQHLLNPLSPFVNNGIRFNTMNKYPKQTANTITRQCIALAPEDQRP